MSYKPIASQTLSSTASIVTFSSLPTTYRDLVLVVDANTNSNNQWRLQFNATTTTYVANRAEARQSDTSSAETGDIGPMNLFNIIGILNSHQVVEIFDYRRTDKYKSVLFHADKPSDPQTQLGGVGMGVGTWENNAAITSVRLQTTVNVFSVGSVFSLYGIEG